MKIWQATLGLVLGAAACSPGEREPAAEERVQDVMTKTAQDGLTPEAALAQLTEGNRRFVDDRMLHRDWKAQAAASAAGQYPKAAVLSCVDSRVPPEIIFDQGIGDMFVGRIAGNFENVDLLGSLEFATAVSGTPLIVVLGHTSCGAVKGAVAGVELGNLTRMLDNFDDVLARVREMQRWADDPENAEFIRAATEENVRMTISDILGTSDVIAGLVASGDVAVVGGIYDLASGQVTWLE